MKFRGVISICITVMGLLVVRALPAFQAADATEAVTKKAKKATKDAAADNAGSTVDTAKKGYHKAKKATFPETGAAKEPASATTDTAKGTIGRADRAASSAAGTVRASTSPAKTASDSEIAAAKASGKVWVNTESGVYHKSGQWYGATRQGKFMTEQDAMKAGYRAAKKK